jgi:outer membrane receptor protein involved in Fe transport
VVATPLHDVGEAVLAAPAVGSTDEDLAAAHALDATDWLRRRGGGVYLNDITGNPLQADVNFRGFSASPLLGTPQGLVVWLDGVRINQPFGDVVSWDLIPKAAIRAMNLVPGSNPLFGRNALGGALVIATKDGRSDPGLRGEAGYGRFNRRTLEAEAGGKMAGGFHYYAAANHFAEAGWRDFSPSRATSGLAKAGWQDSASELALSVLAADTRLNGNGLQEERLLNARRASVYTHPDTTWNNTLLINAAAGHRFNDRLALKANAFWRRLGTRTLNGDANDEVLGSDDVYGDGETPQNTPFPSVACRDEAEENAEPQEACNGLLNRSNSRQREWGGNIELAHASTTAAGTNRFTLGAAFTASRASFGQSSEFGFLTQDRGVIGTGVFADGSQESDEGEDTDVRVDLSARTRSQSLYVLAEVAATRALAINLSARLDATQIRNLDRLNPGPAVGSLTGNHDYHRLNPAASLRWQAADGVALDAAVAQTSRAPSAIELGCADPEAPCRLPNALAGDPPLKQVVARTIEAGLRVERGKAFARAGLFRTTATDDILFVASPRTGFGYFRNFGSTRRQGLELVAGAALRGIDLSASYTLLDATYRSAEIVGGAGNSRNDQGPGGEGNIAIRPGNRIPLLPRHLLKLSADWQALAWLALNADVQAASGVFARGNENNAHVADGGLYPGAGKTRGWAVLNLGAQVMPAKWLTLLVQVDNVLDARFATAAQLGASVFDPAGRFNPLQAGSDAAQGGTFLGPGAPRQWRVATRVRF